MNCMGLYIHIPFCKSKCLYCDFNSFAHKEEYITPYFSALLREASAWAEKLSNKKFDTVYFGGGTPSYIPPALLSSAITEIKRLFTLTEDCEITIECNPATIDVDGLKQLRLVGANRLSIGLQSTNDMCLKTLGRIHTLRDFEECLTAARAAGFDNVSLDLMYGLPDMTISDWNECLDKALAFDAEHISVYALKVEDGTPFSKMTLNLPSEDESADMYELALDRLSKAGYNRYEISNFAKSGRASRHNQKYWHCDDFLGLGAGAYSCVFDSRFSNQTDISKYIKSVLSTGFAVCEKTPLDKKDQMSEFVFLGLRCEDGISLAEFEERFGKSLLTHFAAPIKKYTDWGFLILENGRLRLSDKGFFVSNAILSDFV